MLSMFLKTANVPRLAWLQDIATQDYEQAAAALLQEAAVETRLAEQKVKSSKNILLPMQGAECYVHDVDVAYAFHGEISKGGNSHAIPASRFRNGSKGSRSNRR